MPVSKKRKKEGKPVQRPAPASGSNAENAEGRPSHPQQKMGKPSNPFVGQHQLPRGAQRGR